MYSFLLYNTVIGFPLLIFIFSDFVDEIYFTEETIWNENKSQQISPEK